MPKKRRGEGQKEREWKRNQQSIHTYTAQLASQHDVTQSTTSKGRRTEKQNKILVDNQDDLLCCAVLHYIAGQ